MASLIRKVSTGFLVTTVGLLAFGGIVPSTAIAQDISQPTGKSPVAASIPAKTLAQINALAEEKRHWTPAQRKIDSNLLAATRIWLGQPVAMGVRTVDTGLKPDMIGRVPVLLKATVSAALTTAIEANGGQVLRAYPHANLIEAHIPLVALEGLAKRSDVTAIRRPSRARSFTGPTNSEGDTTHGAATARQAPYNATGTGVKVGVLSDGVTRLGTSQSTGELGAVTVIPGQSGPTGNSGEGTAMLEIVHDVAPNANLAFATAFLSEQGFADNIRSLRFDYGCDIIVDDVLWFDEAVFEDGVVAQAVRDVIQDGALYFSSAGNDGSLKRGTSSVWEGDFKSGGVVSGFGDLHLFTPPNSVTTSDFNTLNGATGDVFLFWSDPLENPSSDYDLYVTDSSDNVIHYSANDQTTYPFSLEAIDASCPAGSHIYVFRWSGGARFLHLETFGAPLQIATTGQTRGHSAAAEAFSVAAVPASNYWDPDGPYPGLFTASSLVEDFSSDGPRRVYFNPNGSLINTSTTSRLSNGGVVRQKPDIAAADGVFTSVPGFRPFFGTSAAAPHAAAIAALVKSYKRTQTNPTRSVDGSKLTTAEIRTVLTSTAIDNMDPGVDPNVGYGIVMPVPALQFLDNFLNQSSVANSTVTTTGTTISWKTLLPSNSAVEYGFTTSYGNTAVGASGVTTHQVTLNTLAPNTLYHYRVRSQTPTGSVSATSPDRTFVTPATVAASAKLQVTGVTLARSGNVSVTVTIGNTGNANATNFTVTKALLNNVATNGALPRAFTIPANSSGQFTLTFPSTILAGTGTFTLNATYSGGGTGTTSFSTALRVTVP